MATYIFGYGSIMDDFDPCDTSVILCHLSSTTYQRSFCFRSSTGFTAVGVSVTKTITTAKPKTKTITMCGVLFQIGVRSSCNENNYIAESTMSLSTLDAREKGYTRVEMNSQQLQCGGTAAEGVALPTFGSSDRIFMYVPDTPQQASKDFPICQTYVDTCLRGCFKWGGQQLMEQWVNETSGWSTYFLNDAPLSRRPWLHRQQYAEIDAVLEGSSSHTFFHERMHPENFSAHWLSNLRGFWGVPPRNPHFTGRGKELQKVMDVFQKSTSSKNVGVTMIETVGLGGVGKTQVAAEYCHRHYSSYYGLVMWWRAETPEVLASDVRRFAEDTGIVVNGVRNEEVVREVLARLFQTTKPWLMVLDNLTNRATLEAYLPRGTGNNIGHILVTSRQFLPGFDANNRVELRCFNMNESLNLLKRVGGEHLDIDEPYECSSSSGGSSSGSSGGSSSSSSSSRGSSSSSKFVETSNETIVKTKTAGEMLAIRLGHLPLALSVASAYMRQCDVNVSSYLRLLDHNAKIHVSSGERLPGYPMGVEESLGLSLRSLRLREGELSSRDRVSSRDVLDVLSYLYPDDISKQIVASIVECLAIEGKDNKMGNVDGIDSMDSNDTHDNSVGNHHVNPSTVSNWWPVIIFGVCSSSSVLVGVSSATSLWHTRKRMAMLAVSSAAVVLSILVPLIVLNESYRRNADEHRFTHPLQSICKVSTSRRAENVNDALTNRIWMKLKKYSLMTVQRGHGSMHRLLQQLLRQDKHDPVRSLSTAIYSILDRWSFDPADPTTWNSAGAVVDHMRVVGQHVLRLLQQNIDRAESNKPLLLELQIKTGDLLTESALYMSMALSRFPEARDILEVAMEIQNVNKHPSIRLSFSMARTLHSAGKVSRYCGRWTESYTFLMSSMELRGGREAHTHDVASDLHELGVLMIKMSRWSEARELLNSSLLIQRTLNTTSKNTTNKTNTTNRNAEDNNDHNNNSRNNTDTTARFCNVSATLHQLAVVAMNTKQRAVAETLLQEALACSVAGPFGVGGRAATLQKLAQVLERRGKRKEAESILKEALQIYEQIYGKDTPHVNIAAVLTNLGENAFCGKMYVEAKNQLESSLQMRKRLYGSSPEVWSGVAGCEIGLNLSKLGEVERAQGQWNDAFQYFVGSGQVFIRLLSRELHEMVVAAVDDTSSTALIQSLSLQLKYSPKSRTTTLFEMRCCRLCVDAWRWQVKVARSSKEMSALKVAEIEKSLTLLKSIQMILEERHKSTDENNTTVPMEVHKVSISFTVAEQKFCTSVAECRACVRSMLTSKDQALKSCREDAVIKLKKMQQVVEGLVIPTGKNELKNVVDLKMSATTFVSVVVSAIAEFMERKVNMQHVKNVVFGATDAVRSALRACEFDVQD